MPAEFDKMVAAIKAQLSKEHPDWKEDKINSSAYTIATADWKKKHGGKGPTESYKLTEDGKIIVGENVKLIIGANIISTGNIMEG